MKFFWLLPPGTLIAVLAFVAFVATFIHPERLTAVRKRIFVAVGLVLVFGEISVLTHSQNEATKDRLDQDKKHEAETEKLLKHFTTVEGLLTAENHVNTLRVKGGNKPTNLRSDALDLSGEILQFLVNRQVSPGYGQGGFGEGGFGGTDTNADEYQKQTIEMYRAAYGNRVVAIHDALTKLGLTDKELEDEYKNPANAYSLKTVAQKIAALAEKLP